MSMQSDTQNGDAFTIDIECDNCGDVFSRSYPSKVHVENVDGRIKVNNTRELGGTSHVQCETCELNRNLNIFNRQPIEDSE